MFVIQTKLVRIRKFLPKWHVTKTKRIYLQVVSQGLDALRVAGSFPSEVGHFQPPEVRPISDSPVLQIHNGVWYI
jgi:hypothetical protein